MTVDQLISADVITADGRSLHASAEENADLFWALRGGGGNFGVVVNFEFALNPVGPDVFTGLIVFPLNDARSLLAQYREFTRSAPDDLAVWIVARRAPPLPFLPAAVHGQEVLVFAVFYAGDPSEGPALVAPLQRFGRAHGEHFGVQPYTAWQQAFDPLLTPGARNYWKSHNFTTLADGVFDTLVEYAGKLPSPHCEVFIAQLGGKAATVAPDAMAYGHRNADFVMNIHGRWEDPDQDALVMGWTRAAFNAARPFATGGVYVNFMPEDDKDRIPAAFGGNYARLVELKRKYDPGNLFHMNQNIAPQ